MKRATFFGLWLFLSLSLAGKVYAQPSNLDQPTAASGEFIEAVEEEPFSSSGEFIKVAEAPLSLGEVLHLSPEHLLALGAGIVVGATVIGPYFGVGEVTGIVIGVITGAFAYKLWSSGHRRW